MGSNGSGRVVLIVVIIVVVLAGSVGAWYLFSYKPEQEAKEQARLEQLAKQEAEKKQKEAAAQRKINFDNLIQSADIAFQQSDWLNAQSLYSEASSLFPNEQYPKDQLVIVDAEVNKLAELEAKRAAGIIESVSSPTGRFYVIVSSSIDDDLALDYARKLSLEGNNVKLVEHNANELPFYGVSLGDYDTWDQASQASSALSINDNGAWVLKY